MKTNFPISTLAIGIIALVAVLALAVFYGANVDASAQQAGAALSLPQAATPTPTAQAADEIGSTDGILLMGVVIVLIVTMPLLFHKKGK